MTIELCMGSSCFARGNARLLERLEAFLSDHETADVHLVGHLCMGECSQGPNIRIDGKLIQQSGSDHIISLIEDSLSSGSV